MGLRFPKPISLAAARKHATADAEKAWRELRRVVLLRDNFRCRRCKSPDQVDAHHIKFRSVGGEDTTQNVACLCRICHAEVHAYRLSVSGNADKSLHFEVAR